VPVASGPSPASTAFRTDAGTVSRQAAKKHGKKNRSRGLTKLDTGAERTRPFGARQGRALTRNSHRHDHRPLLYTDIKVIKRIPQLPKRLTHLATG
jgi:hypothetical protein